MRSVFTGLAFILLLLVQILAPLLHAHTSGNNGKGVLHVPGLESFYLSHSKKTAQTTDAGQVDGIVVGIAEGLRQPCDNDIEFPSSHNAVVDNPPAILPIALTGRLSADSPCPAVTHDSLWHIPPTRAPPV
ncbi:hypothetical protein RP726_09260 [Candidatus Methylospira mobilis]|uniref:hypothetical protein n=1 Tax=Candidatus Methylospira mobilis TaxID=1808979 RepID=UPI0028ED04A8|nr:hypothetical protein [Candidatus Methylospira mobilis]WNV06577.1 hypothetical protein RP726_09260 [Candidatus Methylospira mobilis]